MLTNSFLVAVHTALITAFTVLLIEKVLLPTRTGLAPFLAVLLHVLLESRCMPAKPTSH